MSTTTTRKALPRVHLQIIRALSQIEPASPYQLIPKQDGTLTDFFNALQELKKIGLISEAKKKLPPIDDQDKTERVVEIVSLTELGKKEAASRTCVLTHLACKTCNGRGVASIFESKAFLDEYNSILKGRPSPISEYDQQEITTENMMLRAAWMDERGDIADKRILIIGDDDMLSIALSLSGLPAHVTVLEVDHRINDFINKVAKERGFRLDAHNFDVREKFPFEKFASSYDVFNCDPVETVNGIKLFFSAGLTALKPQPGTSCYFGQTTQEAGTKKWYQIQKVFSEMNLVVTDIKRSFNEYECTDFDDTFITERKLGPNHDKHRWYWSALWRLEAIDVPKPIVLLDGTHMEGLNYDIYNDDETWATPTESNKPM